MVSHNGVEQLEDGPRLQAQATTIPRTVFTKAALDFIVIENISRCTSKEHRQIMQNRERENSTNKKREEQKL